MYPTYVVRRAPSHGRHFGRCTPPARALSSFPPAPFFARGHPFFGPPAHHGPHGRGPADIFDHFDDFVNRSFEGFLPPALRGQQQQQARQGQQSFVWQPRFDVQEVEWAYQLRGELPGVDAKDLEVEFTNEKTLVIRGQTVSERTEGEKPEQQQAAADGTATETETAAPAQEAQPEKANDDAASVASDSSYVQPTVEDEETSDRRESVGTPAEPETRQQQTIDQVAQQPQAEQPQTKYWVSERSTGSFARTFEFPGRIDADGVTASLKNGILDVNVPKARAPEAKRIQVQ